MSQDGLDELTARVADCATAGVARQAFVLRVDRLPVTLRRPHRIRLAEAALAPMLRLPRAELFRLPGASLAVLWRGDAESVLLDVIDELQLLLSDPAAGVPSLADIVTLYDLPDTGDLLLSALNRPAPGHDNLVPSSVALALDPPFLALLERCLAQADVARFARRETIWNLDDGCATPAWEERSLCIAELTTELALGYDLRSEPWLYRRFTRTLDRRILALLASPGELAASGPFSVTLNIRSVLGPDFLRFDTALPATLRGRIVIGFSPADVVADAQSFSFAAGFVRARGYRMLLRTECAGVLPVIAPMLREFDHVTLPWADEAALESNLLRDELWPARAILTGCDSLAAIRWGVDRGIRHFSGLTLETYAPA